MSYKATAIGRAASKYVQDRLAQLPVAQTLDFLWFQVPVCLRFAAPVTPLPRGAL